MHLLFDISGHGFGHAGMTVPLIERAHASFSGVRTTIRSSLPEQKLRDRIHVPFEVAAPPPDPTLAMLSPFDVDVEASGRQYRDLFSRWDEVITSEAGRLRALEADLVLANIPFVSLAAARACGVPAVALSPLNWADIYWALCWKEPHAEQIHAKILSAYRSARVYLQPTPSMPMEALPNRRRIGPLARVGRRQRDVLADIDNDGAEHFVLISFGGIPGRPTFVVPQIRGVRWFVPDDYEMRRRDITRHSASGLSFLNLFASCDVVITKPGYGMFTEAACNGVKVAYLPRPEWPEAPYLVEWLRGVGLTRELREPAFLKGDIIQEIEELLAAPRPAPVPASGVEDALDEIKKLLSVQGLS